MNADSSFFWEAVETGELRIQRCADCQKLRHPPQPMCAACNSFHWESIRASGRGEIYSYVVHHHPPVYGLETPFAVALIQLEEGTRIVGNLIADLDEIYVGMPVEVSFERVEESWTLPQWRPAGSREATQPGG